MSAELTQKVDRGWLHIKQAPIDPVKIDNDFFTEGLV